MAQQIFEDWSRSGETPAIAKLIGFEMTVFETDHVVMELAAGPQHANPMGTLHGGILCDVADAAMGTAWASGIAPSETFTTVELKMNFFRPFWSGKVIAEATVVRRGKTVGYIECDLRDEAGRLIAKAASTCMTLRGEAAGGR